jgi:hypothetical protein
MIISVLVLATTSTMAESAGSARDSESSNEQSPAATSRLVIDTDSTVALTLNGTVAGELLEGEARTVDVFPGDQVLQFRTPDGLVADTMTATVPRGEQRHIGIRIRQRLFAARAETARRRFEAALDTYDRDVRVELKQAFDQLRQAGLASSDDEERLETALVGSVSEWLSSAEFQAEFDRRKAQGLFSAYTEGRNNAGESQFRALFRALPAGVAGWECRSGMTKAGYEQRHTLLVGQGFRRVSLQMFTDATGSVRYQATWLKFR